MGIDLSKVVKNNTHSSIQKIFIEHLLCPRRCRNEKTWSLTLNCSHSSGKANIKNPQARQINVITESEVHR